tara:strand:- start:1193 stop:1942 length:750 start_codon:yes stop_codon:yes gene_type:complete
MEKKQPQFPAEEVTLPSKGLLYPEDSPLRKGIIEMKYMTAREEDILTNPNLIENGTVIDKLLESLIVTPIDYNTLLTGDKDAILIAARVLGYGNEYSFTHRGEEITIDLNNIKDKPLDESLVVEGKNEFSFTLPLSKKDLTFKFLTHGDETMIQKELKGAKRVNKTATNDLTTRMKHIITSIDSDYEKKTIREYVDSEFLARDARELRNYIKKIQPSVDLSYDYEDQRGNVTTIDIPVGINFFWPDASI